MSTPFSTQKIQQTPTSTLRTPTSASRPVYNLLAGDDTQFTQETRPITPPVLDGNPAASRAAGRFALWANPAYQVLQAKAAAAARRS